MGYPARSLRLGGEALILRFFPFHIISILNARAASHEAAPHGLTSVSFPGQNLNTAPLPSAPPSARIEPQGRPTCSRAARRRLYEIERNDPQPAAGKGLTQEQVAQALGVSGPAVNKWERGACCPDLALLAPLARLLTPI